MTQKISLKTVILEMISVTPQIRQLGMRQLERIFLSISPQFYDKISYGLYYYFYFADGFDQQEIYTDQIINLMRKLSLEKQQLFFQSLTVIFVSYQ